jgi:hypothetical protein
MDAATVHRLYFLQPHSGDTMQVEARDVSRCVVCFRFRPLDTYQCKQGHLMCGSCTATVTEKFGKCPMCRQNISDMSRCLVLAHLVDVTNSSFECPSGCGEEITVKGMTTHIRTCSHRIVRCPFLHCGGEMKLQDMRAHLFFAHSDNCIVKDVDSTIVVPRTYITEEFSCVLYTAERAVVFTIIPSDTALCMRAYDVQPTCGPTLNVVLRATSETAIVESQVIAWPVADSENAPSVTVHLQQFEDDSCVEIFSVRRSRNAS